MRITWENIDTLEYTPVPGVEYQIAEGCVRRLRRPVYNVMRDYMQRLNAAKPNAALTDPDHEDAVRMDCLAICTEGDPIPNGWDGVDITIATRAVSDFFTFRIPRPSRPPKS